MSKSMMHLLKKKNDKPNGVGYEYFSQYFDQQRFCNSMPLCHLDGVSTTNQKPRGVACIFIIDPGQADHASLLATQVGTASVNTGKRVRDS